MVLQQLGGGYDDVQDTEPTNPKKGDTWFDTSTDNGTGKIYADLGSGLDWQTLPVQKELEQGRTRELLLLSQNKPVPEVVDPLNIQSSLSDNVTTDADGDYILTDRELGTTASTQVDADDNVTGQYGARINPNTDLDGIIVTAEGGTTNADSVDLNDSNGNNLDTASISPGNSAELNATLNSGTNYRVVIYNSGGSMQHRTDDSEGPYTSSDIDITAGVDGSGNAFSNVYNVSSIQAVITASAKLDGNVVDSFAAPTTAPADFEQWESIKAQDVTTGGSTSADPVAFEILDSSDTVLNSSRIPKSELADEEFQLRNRIYSEDATSDGQSGYTIATTGDGGHFGIPVLTVVSVKKNGSVLDSANWSFDPPTDTVTIDTANVTIASGDTIEIKYDFDVFDSTLQPRAYLSRESTSETSPSISNFRYEYVI